MPAGTHRVEETVRRSRFIATLGRAENPDAARTFIRGIERDLPDATHHCWAFVAGAPGATTHIGLSDAGEPHGTAGRPILDALLHSGVGEVVAVVTRYFGGVKLGKGGLARAYASATTLGLESLPTVHRVSLVGVRTVVDYAALDALHAVLEDRGARERKDRFLPTGEAEVRAHVPAVEVERVRSELARITRGTAKLELEREESPDASK